MFVAFSFQSIRTKKKGSQQPPFNFLSSLIYIVKLTITIRIKITTTVDKTL